MALKESQVTKAMKALKQNPDGQIFIKFLEELAKENYEKFKTAEKDDLSVCQGYAKCVDNLLDNFEQCDIKQPRKKKEIEAPNAI